MKQPNPHNALPRRHEADIAQSTASALGDTVVQTTVERRPAPEAVKHLENASMPLPMKIDALLVALGEKPATLNRFTSGEWESGSQPQRVSDAAVKEYVETVQGLGVYVEVAPDRVVNPWTEYTKGSDGDVIKRSNPDWQEKVNKGDQQVWRTVLVAGSPESLDLIRLGNQQNDARLLGKAYGFPETATEAYLYGQPMYPSDVNGADTATLAFARYGLSAEHALEELGTAERWSEAIRQVSPGLYTEMVERAHGAVR